MLLSLDALALYLAFPLLFSRCNVAVLEMFNTKAVSKMELVPQLVSTLLGLVPGPNGAGAHGVKN